jgi:hypothetical protein
MQPYLILLVEGLLPLGQVSPLGADIITSYVFGMHAVGASMFSSLLESGDDIREVAACRPSSPVATAGCGKYMDEGLPLVSHESLRSTLIVDGDIAPALRSAVTAL